MEGPEELWWGREEGDYIPIATVTAGITSALRWAAMRAIVMFHNCEGQRHKISSDHNF